MRSQFSFKVDLSCYIWNIYCRDIPIQNMSVKFFFQNTKQITHVAMPHIAQTPLLKPCKGHYTPTWDQRMRTKGVPTFTSATLSASATSPATPPAYEHTANTSIDEWQWLSLPAGSGSVNSQSEWLLGPTFSDLPRCWIGRGRCEKVP